jgi:hypothetical protein
MRPSPLQLLEGLAIGLLAGCVVATNPNYPAEWATLDTRRLGHCPAIEGIYVSTGSMALETGVECSTHSTAKKGDWQCSLDLATNLGMAGSGGAPVRLRQPDGETLEVTPLSENATIPTVLKEGKDFRCDADSLYFSGTENVFGSKFMSAVGLVVLTGGVANHTRAFARAENGELVMTVRGRMLFFYVGFPIATSGTSYVRWVPSPLAGQAK